MSGLNLVVPLTPLLLALLLLVPSWQQRVWNLLPWAAVPLLAPLLLDAGVLELPWLFLGTRLGLDATSTPFAWLTVVAWTAAGWFVRRTMADDEHRIRFALFWLLTLCGNLGVFMALDMASFYFSYALMTFAAYGLVLHEGTDEARRAGRIYLILALIGEGLLIAGLVMLAAQFGNADLRDLHAGLAIMQNPLLPALLLFTGFAIKAGLVPLHVWLPLAHPIAPVPASAVLSGVIIKAGLIGWLRFIPVGEIGLPGSGLPGSGLPEFGNLITGLGLLTAFYAVFVGLAQSRPKTVLAYSSVSQMGLMAALFGLGLVHPGAWPVLFTVLGVFVLHHGLNKTALFLGVRMASDGGSGTRFGLLLAALALTGAPLTSGAVAKTLYKVQIDAIGAPGVLAVVLAFSSVATGCLMARLLYLAWPQRRQPAPLSLAVCWWLLLALALILPWWWAWRADPLEPAYALEPASLWASAWPLLVVIALALAAWKLLRRAPQVPEGDLLLVYEALLSPLRRLLTQPADLPRLRLPGQRLHGAPVLIRLESRLLRFSSAGLLLLLLGLALVLAVMLG